MPETETILRIDGKPRSESRIIIQVHILVLLSEEREILSYPP